MSYDLFWFACKAASCDPVAIGEAIKLEQNQASLELLEQSGVSISGIPGIDISTPEKGTHELLKKLDFDDMNKRINTAIPPGWSVIGGSDQECSWQFDDGAIQISWNDRYVIASSFGNFEVGIEALYKSFAAEGFICFDPQTNKAIL